MQKRRGHASSLPLTEADAVKMSGGMNVIFGGGSPMRVAVPGRKRRKAGKRELRSYDNRRLWGLVFAVGLVVIGALYFLSSASITSSTTDAEGNAPIRRRRGLAGLLLNRKRRQQGQKPLPLAHFPTLQYPLQHAKLVGLYFAASWCPHSTPVTAALDEYYQKLILPPKSQEEEDSAVVTEQYPLAIVHVSSDTKEAKFDEYLRPNWIAVPFESIERTALKKHFEVCSKPEVESLGIHRKHEIPTLLIIDSETQTILTTNGVDDLEEFKEQALQHWTELLGLVRGMEGKYSNEEDTGANEGDKDDDGLEHDPSARRRRAKNSGGDITGAVGDLFGPN